ncbi:MAG: Asp-tRNA(Asn)/Glu-tRNA(Gln) amidotransferase subunit GatC [Parcubacteria group bacterium]
MAITPQEVEHVARLARIGLTPAEIKRFTGELTKILDFVSQLKEVDIAHVVETSHVTGLSNVTRSDKPAKPLDRQTFLDGAPAHEQKQLKVKGVFTS